MPGRTRTCCSPTRTAAASFQAASASHSLPASARAKRHLARGRVRPGHLVDPPAGRPRQSCTSSRSTGWPTVRRSSRKAPACSGLPPRTSASTTSASPRRHR